MRLAKLAYVLTVLLLGMARPASAQVWCNGSFWGSVCSPGSNYCVYCGFSYCAVLCTGENNYQQCVRDVVNTCNGYGSGTLAALPQEGGKHLAKTTRRKLIGAALAAPTITLVSDAPAPAESAPPAYPPSADMLRYGADRLAKYWVDHGDPVTGVIVAEGFVISQRINAGTWTNDDLAEMLSAATGSAGGFGRALALTFLRQFWGHGHLTAVQQQAIFEAARQNVHHSDYQPRLIAIGLLSDIHTPAARTIITHLAADPDERVALAVRHHLNTWSGAPPVKLR